MKLGTLVRLAKAEDAQAKFAQLHQWGFSCCQLVYKPERYIRRDAEIIRAAADAEGIEITAQFCGFYDSDTVWDNYYGFLTAGLNVEAYRRERLDYVRNAAEFVSWLGITDMIIHAGYVPNNPFSPEYASLLTAVELLARHCEKLGVNVLFETGGESPVTLLRLIRDIGRNNLYINLDPANILMYGYGNPVDALYTFGSYVRNMHGKDGMPPTDPRILGEERRMGEGAVDFPTLLRRLKEIGYDRYIIIEREIDGDQQQSDVLHAKSFFEQLLSTL